MAGTYGEKSREGPIGGRERERIERGKRERKRRTSERDKKDSLLFLESAILSAAEERVRED